MVKQKAVRNFLLEAIKGLSKEYFDELVRIFQLSYLHNSEAIFVDGTNDGGCDIKLYQNKREIKKCVQVTVQKHVETKIKKELLEMLKENREDYIKFYKDFGIQLKYGVYTNFNAKETLSELLMFNSSLNKEYITLEEYVSRTKGNKSL